MRCPPDNSFSVIVLDPKQPAESFQSVPLEASTLNGAEPIAKLLAEVHALAIRLRQKSRTVAGRPGELAGAEHAVMHIIHRMGALTVPQIARERSTSRQNIQILVDRLVAHGTLETLPNPAHKRSVLVQLTPKGKSSLSAGEQGHRQILSQIGSHLSETEINAAVSVLQKIHRLLPSAKAMEPAEPASNSLSANRRLARKPMGPPDSKSEESDFPVNLL